MSDKAKNNIENEMLKQFFMHGLIGCSDKLSNEKLNYILYQQRLIQER